MSNKSKFSNLRYVYEKAIELFQGDRSAARRWLESPAIALGDKSPLSCLSSDEGVEAVTDLIGRIRTGTFT